MLTNDRNAYRTVFFETWQKYQKKMALDLAETQLIEVILKHPEYHAMLDDPKTHLQQEYASEENPFLHMSLHMALLDQIHRDRPEGIKTIYDSLFAKYEDSLQVEHQMIECLVVMLNQGQMAGVMPSDEEYLLRLRELK